MSPFYMCYDENKLKKWLHKRLNFISVDFRLSNHPDFVGIIPIFLENPESGPICDRDRKNPVFDSCRDIFVKFS